MTRHRIRAGIQSGSAEPDEPELRRRTREAFAQWTSGVTIVSVRSDSGVHALTVSAFAPLSLDPPLLLVALHGDAPLVSHIDEAGRFTVNVLAASQRPLATRFSDRYTLGAGIFPATGDPVLADARATFVCDLETTHHGGDHRIVIGRVVHVLSGTASPPLLFGERSYRE